MTVGERIKKIRLEKEMTQQELAKRTGINDANIRKYESGRQNPKLETLERIAVALEVEPFALAFGFDDKPMTPTTITVDAQKFREAFYNNFLNGNDERDKIIKGVSSYLQELHKDTIEKYDSLNAKGKEKANDYITDLTKIDEYTVPDNEEQQGTGTEDKDNE